MSIQLPDILSAYWSPRLGEFGGVVEDLADIDQCIRIIVATPKGSDPLRPLFGCDAWKYQDAPVDVALPNVVREVYSAIAMWEPRAALVGVTFAAGDDESHWRIRITWRPVGGNGQQITEVDNGSA